MLAQARGWDQNRRALLAFPYSTMLKSPYNYEAGVGSMYPCLSYLRRPLHEDASAGVSFPAAASACGVDTNPSEHKSVTGTP